MHNQTSVPCHMSALQENGKRNADQLLVISQTHSQFKEKCESYTYINKQATSIVLNSASVHMGLCDVNLPLSIC